jgi:hypothetical protein
MITELERRLMDAFHEDAQRARLVHADAPTTSAWLRLSVNQNQASRHRWLLTVAAATVLIAVAGVALIQNTRDDAPTPIAPSPSVPIPSTTSTTPSSTVPVPSTTATPTTIPTGQTQLFTEVAPDTMVTLPPAPIDAPLNATAVWSGTEVITWGVTPTRVGAAFNPATGTWRITAPAPIDGRMWPAAVWTGTEMIVWGGDPFGGGFADGAAYNPATDTWRRLPDAPLGPGAPVAVWTGDEVVVIGAYHIGDAPTNDGRFGNTAVAAYNPATDEWRPLTDLPGRTSPWQAVWTGTTILAPATFADAEGTLTTPVLARYDLSSDTWDTDDHAFYAALVGLPESDGVARTVIALPYDTGAPVAVLDSDGNSIGNLPGIPADGFGDHLSAVGVWAGEEALFWIHGGDLVFIPGDPFEGWALNPATKTWRPLPGNHVIPTQLSDARALVAAGDVVLAWGNASVYQGIAYRAPTTANG